MIILLEGADCSGKTTLAQTLCQAFVDAKYVHHDNTNNSVAEFTRTLSDAAQRRTEGGTTIIDRLWISEMIYGPIMRDINRDPDGIVARLCHMHGVITVMCVRSDLDKHLAHFRQIEKERNEYAKDRIEAVIKAYRDVWEGRYDNDNGPLAGTTLFNHIVRFTPLRMLRSYYQYDMDKHTAAQFTNWLLRVQ